MQPVYSFDFETPGLMNEVYRVEFQFFESCDVIHRLLHLSLGGRLVAHQDLVPRQHGLDGSVLGLCGQETLDGSILKIS